MTGASPVDPGSSSHTLSVETLRRRVAGGVQVRLSATPFLVRRPRLENGSRAGAYVKCELGDQSGWIEAIWWDGGKLPQDRVNALFVAQVWTVEGVARLNSYGNRETPQILMDTASPLQGKDAIDVPGLVRRCERSEKEMAEWLSAQIASVRNRPLRQLLESTLGARGPWRRDFLRAPAAVFYHHAYVGGLAEHVREMASVWLASVATFPKVDRDLTLAGILLHDVGKLDSYDSGPAPQFSRSGRFADHITTGIARLSVAIDAQPDFPPLLRDHLLHIIASHHGEKEHGSPVVPATREAIVVHHLDRLTSLLSHVEEFARQSGVDQYGWSTENSSWIQSKVAISPQIPGSIADPEPQ